MSRTHRSRLSRIAVLASGAMLLLGGSALAQAVAVFDDAPSIEQLRSILIPEAGHSASRSIIIQRPDVDVAPSSVQRISSQPQATARPPVAKSAQSGMQAAAGVPSTQARQAGEAVAFHVNFAFNSAVLPDSADEMIGLIAQLMKEAPEVKIRVEGHTDAVGAPGYNLALSERRALSVGEYLVKQGVDPSRLVLIGKGMSEPLNQNNRYDPANRRVQFVRIG